MLYLLYGNNIRIIWVLESLFWYILCIHIYLKPYINQTRLCKPPGYPSPNRILHESHGTIHAHIIILFNIFCNGTFHNKTFSLILVFVCTRIIDMLSSFDKRITSFYIIYISTNFDIIIPRVIIFRHKNNYNKSLPIQQQ